MKGRIKPYLLWGMLSALRVLVTVAPLGVVFIVKRGEYFTAPGQTMKLSIGGALCMVLLFLAAIGKLKMPRRVVAVFMALSLSWLFGAIVKDLTFLLSMWLIGEVADLMVAPFARRARENITIGRVASATARAVREEAARAEREKAEGSGRV